MWFEVSFYFWITRAGYVNQKNTVVFKFKSQEKASPTAKNAFQLISRGLL